ncbi:hypothetical protein VIGAN_10191100 [Vigna angularis var. angularis]|uniref:Uncharacterized protein n=1 Tax=Vigna angularis var. angularis TaxID=157739 RepID=A0A0S3T5E6_PHAAN|nr:hypothetical protein VIGAN_10191100 [Vigna angularis var. angularis]
MSDKNRKKNQYFRQYFICRIFLPCFRNKNIQTGTKGIADSFSPFCPSSSKTNTLSSSLSARPHIPPSSLYRLCRGLAPDGTPLFSSNSAFPFPDTFFRGLLYLVKFKKPPATLTNPLLQNISSRTSSTERAPISLVSITTREPSCFVHDFKRNCR